MQEFGNMESEEEKVQSRKKRIEKHKGDLQVVIEKAEAAKEVLGGGIANRKRVCGDLERIKEMSQRELFAVEFVEPLVTKIDDDTWQRYERIACSGTDSAGTLSAFYRDIQTEEAKFNEIAAVSGTTVTTIASGTASVVDLFSDFSPRVSEIKTQDTTVENIEFIEGQLSKIEPSIAPNFRILFQDWSSLPDPEKPKRLLDLRSLLFDQFFDRFAPESSYSKCRWYQDANEGAICRKKRYAQVKFFIQDCRDDSQIKESVLKSIDSVAKDMFHNFDDMSNYGKHGALESVAESVFRGTLSSFANVLRLRDQLHGVS